MQTLTIQQLKMISQALKEKVSFYEAQRPYILNLFIDACDKINQAIADKEFEEKKLNF